jgi:hypothetical protein
MTEFIREQRYIVLKIKQLQKLPQELQKELGDWLDRASDHVYLHPKCVVVEHDWPEYETTWRAIEARVNAGELEALSEKVRRGEPISFSQAIAVMEYQARLQKERQERSLVKRFINWLYKNWG